MLGTSVSETSLQLRQRMREFYETSATYKELLGRSRRDLSPTLRRIGNPLCTIRFKDFGSRMR